MLGYVKNACCYCHVLLDAVSVSGVYCDASCSTSRDLQVMCSCVVLPAAQQCFDTSCATRQLTAVYLLPLHCHVSALFFCPVQFLAAAAIAQSADTTAPIVTASAAVDIEVTGCSGTPPEAAALTLVRSYKTRLMQWSATKQTAPPIDGAFTYVPGGANTVNVTVLFSRQLKGGQQVSVAGTGSVKTGAQKPVFGRSRVSAVCYWFCALCCTCISAGNVGCCKPAAVQP
jgi:hypothetical protein